MGRRPAGTLLGTVVAALYVLLAISVTPATSIRLMEMIVRTGDTIETEADVEYLVAKALDTHIEGTLAPPKTISRGPSWLISHAPLSGTGISVLMKDDETGELYYSGSVVPYTRSHNASSAGLDYDSLIQYLISTARYPLPPSTALSVSDGSLLLTVYVVHEA